MNLWNNTRWFLGIPSWLYAARTRWPIGGGSLSGSLPCYHTKLGNKNVGAIVFRSLTLTPKSPGLRPRFFWPGQTLHPKGWMVFHQRKRRGWSVWCVFFRALLASLTVFCFLFVCIQHICPPQMAVIDASGDQFPVSSWPHNLAPHLITTSVFTIQVLRRPRCIGWIVLPFPFVVLVVSVLCSSSQVMLVSPCQKSRTHRLTETCGCSLRV